jgi:hypothetical protein
MGDRRAPDFESLERAVSRVYVPTLILAGGAPGDSDAIALLNDRPLKKGRATAYVCRGFSCSAPTNDPKAVEQQLLDANLTNKERIQPGA